MIQIRKKKHIKNFNDNKSNDLYGKLPIWRVILRVGITGIFMSFVLGLFTFVDQIMLVNFMPLTNRFSFDNLFFNNHINIFQEIIKDINNTNSEQNQELYNYIIQSKGKNESILENLIKSIANGNGLGFYSSDSIVRDAVTLTVAISDIVYILPSLYAIGASIKYSQALGKQDFSLAKHIWKNSFYGTVFVTLIGSVIILILIPLITPAQAIKNTISDTNFVNFQNNITNIINNNSGKGYSNQYIDLKNNIETIYFQKVGDTYKYYFKVGENSYINITNNNLLDINSSNFSSYVTSNLHLTNYIKFNLFSSGNSSLTGIWNNYFAVVRSDSIKWAENFLYIISASLIISSVSSLLITILRSDGVIYMTTFITVFPIIIDIILDYVFIWYAQIGMEGAACATLIGWFLQVVCAMLYIKFSRNLHTAISWNSLKNNGIHLSKKTLWELCMYGGTVFIGNLGWMVTDILLTNQVTIVSNDVIKDIGSEYYLSIMGAVLPIVNLFAITIIGLLQFLSPIFSYNFATKNYKRFKESFWYVTLFIFVCTFSVYFIINFIPSVYEEIFSWFQINNNTSNYELLSSLKLLRIWFIQVLSYTLTIDGMICFLSANRPGLSTLFGLLRSCIFFIPFLYVFASISTNLTSQLNNGLTTDQINNPYLNNAMWFFMWNIGASYIVGAVVIFALTWNFVYKYIQHEKRHLWNCYPYVLFKKLYVKKLLREK